MPPTAATEHYRNQQVRALRAEALVRNEWRQVSGDLDTEWERVRARVSLIVASAQLGAARDGVAYVPAALGELGEATPADFDVRPASLSGVASDGRPLGTLLDGVTVKAKIAIAQGQPNSEALQTAGRWIGMVTRTQVADAGRSSTGLGVFARRGIGYVRYVSPPSCARCALLAGKWFRSNQGFQRHPACFPAGVVVSGPSFDAATRRWFQGELVTLTTASGQQLSLTGNHPVLTRGGWLPANLIQEGDDVVRSTWPQGATALKIPNHDEMPALVEDVWDAFRVNGLERVPASAKDFHGDGQDGEVDIVYADRPLWRRVDAPISQQSGEGSFPVGVMSTTALDIEGATQLVDLRSPSHARRPVGGSGLALTLQRGHTSGPNLPSFTSAATLDPGLDQSLSDGSARDIVLTGKRQFASPAGVGGDYLGHGEVVPPPRWDAPQLPFSMESSEGYTRLGRDLGDRLAGQVEVDRVVELRRVKWAGHVFSLTSSEGWHTANSLIVSNCDCIHLPASQDAAPALVSSPDELFSGGQVRGLTNAETSALSQGADPGSVINARRGMTPDGMYTTEHAGRRRRPTPEAIFRFSKTRDEAVRALVENGYVTAPIAVGV